jgi:hypothetical protein
MGWKPLKRTISLVSYSSIEEDSWEAKSPEADHEDTIKQKGETADEQVECGLAAESLLQRLVRLPNKAGVGSKRTRTGPRPPVLNQVGEKQRFFFGGEEWPLF